MACKRFDSGCLDISKMKMAKVKIKGIDDQVIMNNAVYTKYEERDLWRVYHLYKGSSIFWVLAFGSNLLCEKMM